MPKRFYNCHVQNTALIMVAKRKHEAPAGGVDEVILANEGLCCEKDGKTTYPIIVISD